MRGKALPYIFKGIPHTSNVNYIYTLVNIDMVIIMLRVVQIYHLTNSDDIAKIAKERGHNSQNWWKLFPKISKLASLHVSYLMNYAWRIKSARMYNHKKFVSSWYSYLRIDVWCSIAFKKCYCFWHSSHGWTKSYHSVHDQRVIACILYLVYGCHPRIALTLNIPWLHQTCLANRGCLSKMPSAS